MSSFLFLLDPFHLVDPAGQISRTESIVNIDHTASGSAGIRALTEGADNPPKLAPYPTLVGTAITGQSTRPPTTEARAPSIPATAMTHRALISGIQIRQQTVKSRHPHVIKPGHMISIAQR